MASIITIDTADIARMLKVKRRYATDHIVRQPGFPRPVINLSQRIRRWNQADVLLWIKKRSS